MPTGKPRKKQIAVTAPPANLLPRLTAGETAAVFQILLQKHPDLTSEAEAIATEVVASISAEDIAEDVCSSVTSLDLDDLNGRAGKHSWGYVEPTEAAEELLQEAVADYFEDMKRKIDLGLERAAEVVCTGIVLGLLRATREKSEVVLEWAPDFPAEHAGYVITEYLSQCPKDRRRGAGKRLAAALAPSAPDWSDIISAIVTRSLAR